MIVKYKIIDTKFVHYCLTFDEFAYLGPMYYKLKRCDTGKEYFVYSPN